MAHRHHDRALVWVVLRSTCSGTIIKRRERHLYVAIWFYIATVVTVAVLHIVNSLALPVNFLKSYSVFAEFGMPWCNGGTATTRSRSS